MRECTRKTLTAQAEEKAMEEHDGLVHAFIRRQGGGDIPYEEAVQAGRIGLWRAIRGYDPTRGTAFSTYAWVAICRHIHCRVKELKQDTDSGTQEVPVSWVVPDPGGEMERKLIREVLRDLVNQLPERLGQVIVGRYGLGEEALCTLKELGKEMGFTGERVRQLQQDGLAWLRDPVHSWRLRQLMGGTRQPITGVPWRRTQHCGVHGGRSDERCQETHSH